MINVQPLNAQPELIPTRLSLLSRLKDWGDQASWKDFFDTYWKLIYSAGIKAGLTDAEAQDVVQETVLSVLKNMATFKYDASRGSFKTWLLRLTSWRIVDQLRKRQKLLNDEEEEDPDETSTRTDLLERVADPVSLSLEQTWDEQWEENLVDAAIERVKKKVDAKQYQVFDLHVFKKWSVARVARTLEINPGRVYLIKHRINNLIKKEIGYLRTTPI